MKHNIFKYIAIAAGLLATAATAQAQYHDEGTGVKTSKTVDGPDDDGFYTITLETFATGTTTVTETATPVDVVLVLDISGSMVQPKGPQTNVANGTNISYNTVKNGEVCYFYRDSDGDYDQIYAEEYNGKYYLYYDYGQGRNYIYNGNNGYGTTSSSRPNNAPDNADQTIFTARISNNGTVSTVTAEISRIEALKDAVKSFIGEIELNDHQDKQGNERARLGNRISIVTFSNSATRVCGFTKTEGNVNTLENYVDNFVVGGGTNAGQGMSEANRVLEGAAANANKVVVMFTDGQPTDNYNAITQSRTTKGDRKAIVYTVGTFTESPATNSNTYKYLNAVSSNYGSDVNFTTSYNGNITITGTGAMGGSYYKDASGNVDLTAIFKEISEGIGGSTETIGSTTQVRDVVSNSFVIPSDTQPSDIKVYTAPATSETGWGSRTAFNATVNIVSVDAEGKPVADDAPTATNRAVIVEGFDFSKDDTSQGAGDGNWVGQRYNASHNPQYFWAGKKLIIEIMIKANGDATGGTGTATNAPTSGVYLKKEDGSYDCINHYDVPHTTLTTTIKIRKTGLRSGESATFEIMKIRPKGWDESKTLQENIENIEYNIIGKPLPNSNNYTGPETGSDLYKKKGWKPFSKVVLTNKSKTDGAEVVKTLLALDPYWVYMVLEDDWGWAYDMSGNNMTDSDGLTTTSSVEINPFRFKNTEKTDAVKHAEAVTINHFGRTIQGGEFDGKQEEHYKSSKVESFKSE